MDIKNTLQKFFIGTCLMVSISSTCVTTPGNIVHWESLNDTQKNQFNTLNEKLRSGSPDIIDDISSCEPILLEAITVTTKGPSSSLLCCAIKFKNINAVKAIVQKNKKSLNQMFSCPISQEKHGKLRELTILGVAIQEAMKAYKQGKTKEYDPIVSFLVENGADVTISPIPGATMLHATAGLGLVQSTEAVITTGKLDINAPSERDNTPLDVALKYGQLASVTILIKNKAMVRQQTLENTFALPPLSLLKFGTIILKAAFDNNKLYPDYKIDFTKKINGKSLMIHARDHVESLPENYPDKRILEEKLNPLITTNKTVYLTDLGSTGIEQYNELFNKINNPQLDVSKDILKCNHDLLKSINGTSSLLHHAVNRRNLGAVRAIIGRDKSLVNLWNIHSYTDPSSKKEMQAEISLLTQAFQCANQCSEEARKEYDAIISFLVENGANVTVPPFDNTTTLHVAAVLGLRESIQAIIATGKLDINDTRDKNDTPLELALHYNQPESVKILVKNKPLIRQETLKYALLRVGLDNEIRTLILETAFKNNLSNIDLNETLGNGETLGKHVENYIDDLSKDHPHMLRLAQAFKICTNPGKNILTSLQEFAAHIKETQPIDEQPKPNEQLSPQPSSDNKSDEDKSRSPLLIGAGTIVLLGCMVGIGNFLYKRFKTKKVPPAAKSKEKREPTHIQ